MKEVKSIYFMNLEATKWQYVSNVLQNLSINFSCKISLARCSRAYHPSDFTAEYTFALSFFLSVERSVFYIERCIFGTGAPTANTSVEVAAACGKPCVNRGRACGPACDPRGRGQCAPPYPLSSHRAKKQLDGRTTMRRVGNFDCVTTCVDSIS